MWLYPLLTMSFFGATFGVGLAYASRKFAVKTDPRVQELLAALPGINCGGCGFAGCAGYADAVAAGNAAPNVCSPGGPDVVKQLCAILGLSADINERRVAVVRCAGAATAKRDAAYAGVQTCALAALVGEGFLACKNGCLLYGDCVQACAFDALEWTPGSVPRVREDKCTACRKCIAVCPKALITLRPESKSVQVICRSQDRGAIAKQKCAVACIACTKCVKTCPVQAISMDGQVAVIDSAACTLCGKCVEACPTHAIQQAHAAA